MSGSERSVAALIFDMDGVILDTESLVLRCWRQLAPEYGIEQADDLFLQSVGTTRRHTGEMLCTRFGADFPAEAFNSHVSRVFHAIADREGIPLKKGAREILQWACAGGIPVGLASSTRQATVEKELRQAGLYDFFTHVLGGDRIARSKPFPDIYTAACRAMQVPPHRAIAVEDSYNGIRAAAAAGMQPVMIPDLLPPTGEMFALCRAVLPDLTQLRSLLSEEHAVSSVSP